MDPACLSVGLSTPPKPSLKSTAISPNMSADRKLVPRGSFVRQIGPPTSREPSQVLHIHPSCCIYMSTLPRDVPSSPRFVGRQVLYLTGWS